MRVRVVQDVRLQRLAQPQSLLGETCVHRDHHVVRHPPHEYASVPAGRDQSSAVVGEAQPGGQLRVAAHGGHALAGVIVVDREAFVGAGGGQEYARPVQHHLEQRAVVAAAALEAFRVLAVGDAVYSDVSVLAGG